MNSKQTILHAFDVDLASTHGVYEAIFLQNMLHWIIKNRANKKHFHEGRTWTYNSRKAFTFIFSYWNERQIRTVITHLLEKGIIISGNFSQDNRDRTNWYAFNVESEWLPEEESDETKKSNAADLKVQCSGLKSPVPHRTKKSNDISTDTKQIENTQGTVSDSSLKAAELIYAVYPKRVGKPKALDAIQKQLKLPPKEGGLPPHELLAKTKAFAMAREGQELRYCPNPATWFNQQRFNDDPSTWVSSPVSLAPKAPSLFEVQKREEQLRNLRHEFQLESDPAKKAKIKEQAEVLKTWLAKHSSVSA